MSDDLPEARVVRDDLVEPPPVPLSPAEQLDLDVSDLANATRQRNARIFAIASVASFAIAAILVGAAIASGAHPEEARAHIFDGSETFTAGYWIAAVGSLIPAVLLAWRAVAARRGRATS
ncbi:MAG TPA: hypothetical protein VGL61_06285 [Kofleriaceae bacterium]|jgi:hypothetical protein